MINIILTNLQSVGLAMLTYIVFWVGNTVAALTLNIKVTNSQEWDKDKFLKSLWKLGGMIGTLILVTIGLSMIETDIFSIDALNGVIIAAALTKLAEAVTKIKNMFEYTTTIAWDKLNPNKIDEEELIIPEPIVIDDDLSDEYHKH